MACSVLPDRLLCVLSNGVVEVLQFATAESARSLLVAFSSVHPRSLNRRRGAAGTAAADGGLVSSNHGNENGGSNSEAAQRSVNLLDLVDFSEPEDILPVSDAVGEGQVGDYARDAESPFSRQLLVHVEKDFTHFDVIPRVPMAGVLSQLSRGLALPPSNNEHGDSDSAFLSVLQRAGGLVTLCSSSPLVFSAGHIDGRVSIREVRKGQLRPLQRYS